MTKKQIILCILPIYKRAIQYITSSKCNVKVGNHVLTVFSIPCGVCYACDKLLGEDVYAKKWIKRNIRGSYAWARFPSGIDTIEEMVASLQIRVDIMERELKRRWWHIFK